MGERERDVRMVAGLQPLSAELPKTFAVRKKQKKMKKLQSSLKSIDDNYLNNCCSVSQSH